MKENKEHSGKKSVLLSVVVSCKGQVEILEKNLSALSRQDLNRKFWNILFFLKEEQKHSPCVSLIKKYFPSQNILFLPKDQPLYKMRNLAFKNGTHPYIYFIDEDVILGNSGHLSRLLELYKEHPGVTVIGGGYFDHPDCSFWGRSYNWIVRLWMKSHSGFAPAGNLAVRTTTTFKARFHSANPFGFGGEEIHFLKALKTQGHLFLLANELSARHLADHGFRDFIQRAWIHGAGLFFEAQTKRPAYLLFFKEKAPVLIKMVGLFYLLVVRFSWFFYKIKALAGR